MPSSTDLGCHVSTIQQQAVDSAMLLAIALPAKKLCSIASFMPHLCIAREAQLIMVMMICFCRLIWLHISYIL